MARGSLMKRMILLVVLMMFLTAGCSADQASSSLEEGMRYLEQGEYGKAAEAFENAVEEEPENADAYLERGKLYLLHGIEINGSYSEEMLERILSDCRKAQELDPSNEGSAACIFYAYTQDNQYKEASESLEAYIAANGSVSDDIKGLLDKVESGQVSDIHDNVRIYTAYDEGGNVRYIYHYNYDRLGRVDSVDWYSADGSLNDHIRYIYDEDGRVIQGFQTTDSFSGEMTPVDYIYDEKGHLITEIWENFNGSPYKRSYHYDENGINDYMEDSVGGEVISVHKRSYDASGHMIAEETYSSNGNLINRMEYSFNEKGLCTDQTMYDRDGKAIQQWAFTYDEGGKLVRTEYYVEGELIDIKGD
jgi:tetratricopeptide (TPR) repeat protein